ncbi:hypothetical protein XENOCAPTIV_021736 [Xenoophorus captivus]|uniref:NUMB domain-containing protein n=1 Tax=Xenoophorus captivus TaxID=1517983 RepID=A0ABV0QKL2_9TELE
MTRPSLTSAEMEPPEDQPSVIPTLPPGSASPPEGTASPIEHPEPGGAHAIPRRHAPIEQLVRQGSFRGFPALSQKNSPFKRQLSLRLNDLPSTLQRKTDFEPKNPALQSGHKRTPSEAERWLEEVSKAVKAQQTPPPGPIIPTILGPPSVASHHISTQATLSSAPVSTLPMPLSTLSKPLISGSSALPCQAQMPLPPMSISSVPLIPGPPVSGPPISLPSMSIPTMSGPSMSGAPMMQSSLAGPPGSLPSAMQPFPLAFDATPAPVGMFASQPVQPAFIPMQTYMPGLASSMTYPNASVPVVGITPSQMVANAFCTATGSSGTGPTTGLAAGGSKAGPLGTVGHHHSYPGPAGAAGHTSGFTTATFSSTPPLSSAINGLPVHSSAAAVNLQNGTLISGGNGGSGGSWPPEGSQLTAPGSSSSQDDDRFEAKWAALETNAATQPTGNKSPAATANPFSNSLQKTFEIEL